MEQKTKSKAEKQPEVAQHSPELVIAEAKRTVVQPDSSKTMRENILDYLSNNEEWTNINDFLKRLYPMPKLGMPPVWTTKPEMKALRMLLEEMENKGEIMLQNPNYKRLGMHYYDNSNKQVFYNLNDINIICKK